MTATRSISIGLFVAVFTLDGVAQPAGRPLPEGAVAHRDLAYVLNGHERQKLDLYLPRNGSNLPLIVNIHGGAFRPLWRFGSRPARCHTPTGSRSVMKFTVELLAAA